MKPLTWGSITSLIKGIYYDEWKPSITPVKDRHIDEFLAHIKENIVQMAQSIWKNCSRGFYRSQKKITEGEIKDVKGMLPEELKSLWGSPC